MIERTVHANATAVAVHGRGLLIEGPPGSGKSTLALMLIDRGAVLIGDDAVGVEARGALCLMTPPPHTAGLIEVRGVGIVTRPVTAAPLALILDLAQPAPRLPDRLSTRTLAGIAVPVLGFAPACPAAAVRAEIALAEHGLGSRDALHGAQD